MEINNIISSGLLELYVLGIANAQEIAQVESLALQYPEVKAEIISIERSMENYAMSNSVQPANHLKKRIQSQIDNSYKSDSDFRQNTSGARIISVSPFWKYAAAASIILLIGSVIISINYYNKYHIAENERIAAQQQKINTEQQLLAQERVNDELKSSMNVVQSKFSEPVALRGLPAAPDAAAKVFWMKNTGDVYIDPSNLPDAPVGKQYQLWAIVEGKPVDAGMIITTTKGDKYKIQKMKSFGKAEAFAVTLEPTGGNPTPKGDMYVMGKL